MKPQRFPVPLNLTLAIILLALLAPLLAGCQSLPARTTINAEAATPTWTAKVSIHVEK